MVQAGWHPVNGVRTSGLTGAYREISAIRSLESPSLSVMLRTRRRLRADVAGLFFGAVRAFQAASARTPVPDSPGQSDFAGFLIFFF